MMNRVCCQLVLKAASAVHVAMVRWAREKEKIHSSLRDFISDVARSNVTIAAHRIDSKSKAESDLSTENLVTNHFRIFKNSLKSVLEPFATNGKLGETPRSKSRGLKST